MTLIVHRGGPQDGGVEEVPSEMAANGTLTYASSRDSVNDCYQRSEPLEHEETAMGSAEVWVHVAGR